MNLPLQNLSCRSRCEEEQWELGREHEEEDARQSVKDVNKTMPRTAYCILKTGDHTSYLRAFEKLASLLD